ncbi:rapamycin-insensitive companion of mTOR isoform X5 [Mesoplodon densirostris]|uniref:rapamycin-insensitive companion of mTOR isoform X5 n=1 Tax=Mesoplodon densirostris TaxID=48708 RepID=UPI0028DCA3B7|nr:rapamycin-insensitive companion of mTOR isoform X5 [Mesoplodon densirostris]
MAAVGRGRSLKNLRIRGRNDSGEENVPLDLTREPSDNLREILQNVAKLQGVSNMRKLGHLNNFTKLLCDIGHNEEKLGFNYEDIIICLRLALLNEAKEVRAAGLRALRYLIQDSSILQKVLKLKVDYLIARCIDIQQSNEVERTQALRLVRKMITVNASLFPSSVANSLIAVGNDGLQERDRMVRACIAIICELALQNPEVVALRGGLNTILKNVIDCQLSRINEALITTILHLLNHPKTRQYVRADVELERILAPYTDFHYRHSPDTAEGQLKEDREARFLASKMGIIATFRSWAGIINLCKPGNSGIQSLIGVLCIPNMEIRRGLLEVLYDIFRLPLPVVTEEFIEALLSVDPGRFQDSWRLSDGFVAAEAKTILPHRARSRPDLMDNYLALILSAFIRNGLLEGLVEVITNSDDHISVRATILLGELLHMANTILPHSHSHHLHCLPTLMNMAASFDIPKEKRLRASAALNCLKRFHEMKKRGPKPYSLHLDHIIQKAIATHQKRDQYLRVQKDIFVLKDTEEALLMNLRDSQVLQHKENLEWNWNLIGTILKWPNVNLRNYKDEQLHRFVRRLLYFYKPSSKLYANLDLDFAKSKQLTVVGCQFTEFLLESEEDGQGYLEDLVKDIVQWLNASSGMKPERSLQNNGLLTTLSQHYFLFIGTLSCHPHGVKMLEKCSVFQCLLNLCSLKNQDHLLKLTVSSLDYSRDGLARVILSKILTAATDACRLYATKHLRVLLRANVEFFNNWGIELLVTQLHDKNKTISSEALDILDEACEDKANLHALIQMKPALSHLGDKGLLLLLRFLSIPKGFSYLNERGYVAKQLEKWHKEYNSKYVDLIEEQLNEALTTYRKPIDGDNYVRRSNQRLQRPHVYLPVHLYGQLVHHKTGCHLLEVQNIITELCHSVRTPDLDKWEEIKKLKASLWALGNIGSSNWGLNLLQEENVIPDILKLAKQCEVLSIRGTCVYVLGLIAKTKQGCDILKCHNWDAVRHSRKHLWPVVPDDVEQLCNELSSVPSTLSLNSESTSSRHNSESESAPSSMFIMEDDRFGSSSTSTFFLDINEDAEPAFYDRSGPMKDKNSFPFFASSKLVKNPLASPAKDVLFTDTITMKANSFESRLTPSRIDFKKKHVGGIRSLRPTITNNLFRFMKALSYASLDKEDLLSPINQNTLQRSSSVRSMVSSATYGSSDDYIGLALPVDINDIFQVKDIPYFQAKNIPPHDDRGARVFAHDAGGLPSGTGGLVKNSFHLLRQQMSLTEIMNSIHSDASLFLESTEDTGLQEHTDDNCLYCVCIEILGFQPSNQLSAICSHSDLQDIPYSDWCEQTIHNPLEVVPSKFSGISGCSDGVSQEGSASSTKSTELLLGVKTIPDDTPMCRILLRKEVLRLVINLSSSVSTKCHETGLLTIKEKYPQTFDDICLYSEVSHLLSHCTFRLPCRRFIQELFQDVQFLQMHEEAEAVLATPPKQPIVDTSVES